MYCVCVCTGMYFTRSEEFNIQRPVRTCSEYHLTQRSVSECKFAHQVNYPTQFVKDTSVKIYHFISLLQQRIQCVCVCVCVCARVCVT